MFVLPLLAIAKKEFVCGALTLYYFIHLNEYPVFNDLVKLLSFGIFLCAKKCDGLTKVGTGIFGLVLTFVI